MFVALGEREITGSFAGREKRKKSSVDGVCGAVGEGGHG